MQMIAVLLGSSKVLMKSFKNPVPMCAALSNNYHYILVFKASIRGGCCNNSRFLDYNSITVTIIFITLNIGINSAIIYLMVYNQPGRVVLDLYPCYWRTSIISDPLLRQSSRNYCQHIQCSPIYQLKCPNCNHNFRIDRRRDLLRKECRYKRSRTNMCCRILIDH